MANLNGINTRDNAAAIRAILYSGVLRTQLEPELQMMKYVDVITDFPDGDSWQDVEIGSATVRDYTEGEDVVFDGLEIGTRTFEINKYKTSAHFVSEKFLQDSYLSAQIWGKLPALEARAIYADLEASILSEHRNMQKAGDANVIGGYRHRFIAGADADAGMQQAGYLTPLDFTYASLALTAAGYTGPRIAIVPLYQEYAIAANKRLVNSLSYNPKWEGIVATGVSSGMQFVFNINGFDVYTSNFTDTVTEKLPLREGATQYTATNAGVAQLFINQPDRRPWRLAWRMMPKFESQWNMVARQEECVTVGRYGLGAGDTANLVSILCAASSESTFDNG